jgi:hypothetical protein
MKAASSTIELWHYGALSFPAHKTSGQLAFIPATEFLGFNESSLANKSTKMFLISGHPSLNPDEVLPKRFRKKVMVSGGFFLVVFFAVFFLAVFFLAASWLRPSFRGMNSKPWCFAFR